MKNEPYIFRSNCVDIMSSWHGGQTEGKRTARYLYRTGLYSLIENSKKSKKGKTIVMIEKFLSHISSYMQTCFQICTILLCHWIEPSSMSIQRIEKYFDIKQTSISMRIKGSWLKLIQWKWWIVNYVWAKQHILFQLLEKILRKSA